MQDLKYAFRQLVMNPGFTALAVLTLALCLGANLTIFAVVDSILLRPLPFPEADRLVTLFNTYPKAGVERVGASLPNYYERRGNIPAFSHVSMIRPDRAIVGDGGSSEQLEIARVSPEFFSTLGMGPSLGRAFTESEMTYQTEGVAILTYAFWQRRFNADSQVLGSRIRVDGLPKTIVGVLPPRFRFLSSKAQLYLPLSSNLEDRGSRERHSANGCEMIARLKPGTSLAEAQSQIDAHNDAHAAEYPGAKMIAEAGFRTVVTSLHADHVKTVRPILVLLQAGVLLLLIIGGVNLVNLLLVRASGRTRELAIRQSLGASQRHVVKQVLTETGLLTLLGGVVGIATGAAGIRLLGVLGLHQLPLGAQVVFDGRLAMAAFLGAMALGLMIALPIVWFNLGGHLAKALQSEGRGGTASHAAQRLRHGFIIAQIALAFVLLAGAGLLGLSLRRTMAVSPGFRPDHILTGQISLPWRNYQDWPSRMTFIARLLEGARGQAAVSAAGVIDNAPFTDANIKTAFNVQGHLRQPGESLRGHYFYGVGGDVFEALRIPLRSGRYLDDGDSSHRVCVVDEDFARLYWPKGSVVGQRLFVGGSEGADSDAFTIVGVVGTIKHEGLTEPTAQGAVYVPYQYRTVANVFVVIRTRQEPGSLGIGLQKIVRAIDPELPVNDLRPMEVRIADSLIVRRSPAMLTGIFAVIALLLAAIGTYGVLAYAVSQRRREIGVRMALGGRPTQIVRQFLSLGLRLLGAGTVLGVAGAWTAERAMQGVLFGVPALPVPMLVGTCAVLAAVSLAACWLPARRAMRVDPIEALSTR